MSVAPVKGVAKGVRMAFAVRRILPFTGADDTRKDTWNYFESQPLL